jgi:hypothetical protein
MCREGYHAVAGYRAVRDTTAGRRGLRSTPRRRSRSLRAPRGSRRSRRRSRSSSRSWAPRRSRTSCRSAQRCNAATLSVAHCVLQRCNGVCCMLSVAPCVLQRCTPCVTTLHSVCCISHSVLQRCTLAMLRVGACTSHRRLRCIVYIGRRGRHDPRAERGGDSAVGAHRRQDRNGHHDRLQRGGTCDVGARTHARARKRSSAVRGAALDCIDRRFIEWTGRSAVEYCCTLRC